MAEELLSMWRGFILRRSCRRAVFSALLVSFGCAMAGSAVRSESGTATLERIEVYPTAVTLNSQRASGQLVVTGYLSDGRQQDYTRTAEIHVADPDIATVEKTRVQPVSNGTTIVRVRVGSLNDTARVAVSGQDEPQPISFRNEVLAALTKQGCNSGSCHGSPNGKSGFALSLMAYSPQLDETSLIQGGLARRTNPIEPMDSLLLKKPLLRLSHVGGKRLRASDRAFEILHGWIAEGASADRPGSAECVAIRVYPGGSQELRLPGDRQQLSVLAEFTDGSVRDVTQIASYQTSDGEIVTCDADGLVSGHERGFAAVMVRYLSEVQSVNFTVVKEPDGFEWMHIPENNYVDTLVNARLKQLQYPASPLCDDSTFLRRVFLDLTGLLPRPDQTRAFLECREPDKRVRLIDQLLESSEFARFWATKSGDLLRLSRGRLTDDQADVFSRWLRQSWKDNQPFDEFTNALLTASGDTSECPPANYYITVSDSESAAETTAQLFMGSRIGCARCHNHPFENWTQNDYYQIAAVFARTKNENGTIIVQEEGEARNPQTGEVMQPWGMNRPAVDAPLNEDRRQAFTKWLTAAENPFYARVEVNRIWAQLMGRGIVEPVDDFRSSNPSSNPALLDALADDFQQSGYDRRHIVRVICCSRTYQRSSAALLQNVADTAFFSHYPARQLTAEQLQDAIGFATRTLAPTESVATELADARAELNAALEELPVNYSQWESDVAAQLAGFPCWQGTWRFTDSFGIKQFDPALASVVGPEEDLNVDWGDTWDNGKRKWVPHPEWVDGKQHITLSGGAGPRFLARRIYTRRPGRAVITLGNTGAIRMWLNGHQVFDSPENRPLVEDDHRVELDLREGANVLLLKMTNGGMMWGFYYNLISFEGESPVRLKVESGPESAFILAVQKIELNPAGTVDLLVDAAELVAIPPDERTEDQQHELVRLQEATNPGITQLKDRVARLTDWLDYQTQRSWPDQDNRFLAAFGQPPRESSCACERRSEATIDQALQLLNGDLVRELTRSGAEIYNQIGDDQKLVDAVYLSAFMRAPRPQERQTAVAYLSGHPDRISAIQDLLWAVVNTREFLFQH